MRLYLLLAREEKELGLTCSRVNTDFLSEQIEEALVILDGIAEGMPNRVFCSLSFRSSIKKTKLIRSCR
jgi:hypothetical protein